MIPSDDDDNNNDEINFDQFDPLSILSELATHQNQQEQQQQQQQNHHQEQQEHHDQSNHNHHQDQDQDQNVISDAELFHQLFQHFQTPQDQYQHAQDLSIALTDLQQSQSTEIHHDPPTHPNDSFDLFFSSESTSRPTFQDPFNNNDLNREFDHLFNPSQEDQDRLVIDETDLLLQTINRRINEDLELEKFDQLVEASLEYNESYSNKIRQLLDLVNRALERGEQLESLATHYVHTLQNPTSSSSHHSSIPTTLTISTISNTNDHSSSSEPLQMLLADRAYTVSLPWFKYKFGADLPIHEDASKRDRYNSILHQQAWQVSERKKLEEEIRIQVKTKINRERNSTTLEPDQEDMIRYSSQVDWKIVAQSLQDRNPIECRIQWNQRQHPSINKNKWSQDEIDRLFEIAKKFKERDWKSITNELGTRRTPAECVKQYRMVTQERRDWSESDDALLKEGVSMYGQNWQAVANHCGRSSNQCINRWSKTLRPDIKKGKWNATEDEALRNAVAACGMVWKDVAPRVRGRTDAQCRERWCNILDPRIVVGNWTREEDEKIVRLRNEGRKTWSEISKSFDGRRTDNHCMRRYSELTKTDPKQRKSLNTTIKIRPTQILNVTPTPSLRPISSRLIDKIQPDLLVSHHRQSTEKRRNDGTGDEGRTDKRSR